MPKWLVRLMGRPRDLRFLASACRDPWRITEEDGEFYLGSSRFEGLNDVREIKLLADEFLDLAGLHALLRFEGYRGVQTDEIVSRNPDGSRHISTVLTPEHAVFYSTFSAVVTKAGSSPVKPHPPDLTRDTSLLERRPSLAQALRYLRDAPRWSGYWKATEALGEEIGGVENIVSYGWATKEELDRFRDTVHHHRHHRKPAPENQMSEGEVSSRLLYWLRRGLDWRLSGRR